MLQTILVFVAAIVVPLITILGTWAKVKIDGRDQRATILSDLSLLDKLADSPGRTALRESVENRVLALANPAQGWSASKARNVLIGYMLFIVTAAGISVAILAATWESPDETQPTAWSSTFSVFPAWFMVCLLITYPWNCGEKQAT
jgi:hypothetical protein